MKNDVCSYETDTECTIQPTSPPTTDCVDEEGRVCEEETTTSTTNCEVNRDCPGQPTTTDCSGSGMVCDEPTTTVDCNVSGVVCNAPTTTIAEVGQPPVPDRELPETGMATSIGIIGICTILLGSFMRRVSRA